jgi:hypothetical protein
LAEPKAVCQKPLRSVQLHGYKAALVGASVSPKNMNQHFSPPPNRTYGGYARSDEGQNLAMVVRPRRSRNPFEIRTLVQTIYDIQSVSIALQ